MKPVTGALAATLVLALGATAGAEPMRELSGTVPRALADMAPIGPAPAGLRLPHVTVLLGLRDRAGLDAVIAAQQDRRSPRFRRWLEPGEIADRFGPTRTEYERVRRWLVEHGLDVVRDSPYRLTVVVAGTVAQVEAALATPIRLFRRRNRVHRGPANEPLLPESLAISVRGVLGLDDLPRFRPLVRLASGETALGPQDFAAAYGVAPLQAAGLTGAGRSIAVVARSNFDDSDVSAFSTLFGIPLHPVRKFADPANDPGIVGADGEETEVLIDTQWAGALAPGAALNVVISTPEGDIPEALQKAVADREGDIITISFGLCEPAARTIDTELFDAYYAIANAQGQTVLVASGDGGATECFPDDRQRLAVNLLASSPHAVAVGGSSFTLEADGSLPAELVESVWSDEFGGSGGGESAVFARPRFQLGAGVPELRGRGLPDVALPASPITPGYVIVEDGEARIVGGTSVGAPAFASVLALVNERLTQTEGTGGLGHLLPALYRLGGEQARGLRAPLFRDITVGSNALPGGPGFRATPGFDLATGWGAPLADALAAALDGPGRCEPELRCLIPARGAKRRACAGAWLVEQERFHLRRGIPTAQQSCRDGDPECDADGRVDGRCTVNVALCLNIFDFRADRLSRRGLPVCEPSVVRRVRLLTPGAGTRAEEARAARSALRAAIDGLPDLPFRLRDACTATVPVTVPAGGDRAAGHRTLRARIEGGLGTRTARVTLTCHAP
jgi:hypothetical protein